MTVALIPGSYDPPTMGHVELIEKAATCFDRVVVAVGVNANKVPMFSVDERRQLLEQALQAVGASNIAVTAFEGATLAAARKIGADCIVKGVREGADLTNERVQATVNYDASGLVTLLLPSSGRWLEVSSSMVKEMIGLGLDPSPYVPEIVSEYLAKRGNDA